MINCSKQKDKKNNKYDADHFIDKCFLEGLVEEYTHCYWEDCKVELQFKDYQDDLATIERLDNTIGHIKSNCVLACRKCNAMKKSNITKDDDTDALDELDNAIKNVNILSDNTDMIDEV